MQLRWLCEKVWLERSRTTCKGIKKHSFDLGVSYVFNLPHRFYCQSSCVVTPFFYFPPPTSPTPPNPPNPHPFPKFCFLHKEWSSSDSFFFWYFPRKQRKIYDSLNIMDSCENLIMWGRLKLLVYSEINVNTCWLLFFVFPF